MARDRHEALVEFLNDRTEAAFRTAFAYDDSGVRPLYVRDDLASNQLKDAVSGLYQRVESRQAFVREGDYRPLGPVEATVELHENAVLLHFQETPQRGIVVTLDRRAATQLVSFVDQCTEILDERNTQTRQVDSASD